MSLLPSVDAWIPLIEQTLAEVLSPLKSNCDPLLGEAARYSVLNPGKRIRPLLTLAAVVSLGGDPYKAIRPACAVEILHTYSLIHDDLPCMDDDDLRRGKPTLHKLYPEGQAVLTGDLLLTLAFEILATSPGIDPDQKVELVRILAEKTGGRGMILGQSLDLLKENQPLSAEDLLEIHRRKTGDLLCACLEFAAVLSGKPALKELLSEVGLAVGLSFQIIDDILGIEGNLALTGKHKRSDIENQKNTAVSVLGLAGAKKRAEELLLSALGKCEEAGLQDSPLTDLLPKLVQRTF